MDRISGVAPGEREQLTSLTFTASGGSSGPYGYHGYELAVDNLTYNAAPVPLPAAAWLLLSALGRLGVLAHRTRKRLDERRLSTAAA
jgi:hypothetical protein